MASKGLVAGRLALVTGAGSGIGRAACQVLSREGATVVAADKNYDAALETIKKHIALASGYSDAGEHSAMEVDVSEPKSVQNLLQAILAEYKVPPKIVVNSAGVTRDNWLLKLSQEDYDSVMNVNLKGTFLIMQTFAKAMTESSIQGSIINISSIVGKYGNIGQTNYSASKAGVVAMTQSAAKELGKFNIRGGLIESVLSYNPRKSVLPFERVNAIMPGFIDTPIIKTVPDKVKEQLLKLVPLGRLGDPTEIAEVITFLSSDKSSFINGASIDVTGGY